MFLKEALNHVQQENDCLRDELQNTQELLRVHKQLLDETLKKQQETLTQCQTQGAEINDCLDVQASFLRKNNYLDSSAISTFSTMYDSVPMDGQFVLNKCDCKSKAANWDQERKEFIAQQEQLASQISRLKQEFQTAMKEAELRAEAAEAREASKDEEEQVSKSRSGLHTTDSDDSDDRKYATFKKVLMPMLEDFADENDQLIF